jgi:hypothetical protein
VDGEKWRLSVLTTPDTLKTPKPNMTPEVLNAVFKSGKGPSMNIPLVDKWHVTSVAHTEQ